MSKTTRLTLVCAVAASPMAGCVDDDTTADPGSTHRFAVTLENISPPRPLIHAGRFDAIGPGGILELSFTAGRRQRVSFATMFAESNDWFFGPPAEGLALYDADGAPRSGDVTAEIKLWDAGTEADQEPGLGPDQAPRQQAPNTGARDLNNTVRPAENRFGNLPAVDQVLRVTLTPVEDQVFRLRIENVSTTATLVTSDGQTRAVPLSAGAWAVHEGRDPIYSGGFRDRGLGLEAIAEDGDPAGLNGNLTPLAGVPVMMSPGVWLIHGDDGALFAQGERDRGDGLERLAEDGDASALGEVASGTFTTGVDEEMPGAIGPGGAFVFHVEASPGDRLSFATMFGESNDAFFAPPPEGLALFHDDGAPWLGHRDGVQLWDAGTEVDQEPGVGNDQAPRQLAPDTGTPEHEPIGPAEGPFPDPSGVLRVTIAPAVR